MGLRKILLKGLKSFFEKKSSQREQPENEAFRNAATNPRHVPAVGDHKSMRTLIDERGGEIMKPVIIKDGPEDRTSSVDQELRRTETSGPTDSSEHRFKLIVSDTDHKEPLHDGKDSMGPQRMVDTKYLTHQRPEERPGAGSTRPAPYNDPGPDSTPTNTNENQGVSYRSGQPPIAMFDRLQNTWISGGTFVQNITGNQIRPGLKLLQERVATSAFHNSAQRVDPPRCHPKTRVAIQKQIYDWIIMDLLTRQAWIMWMHGAAGAGKSAIIQSIAELCEQEHIPLASFFFFRTDPTRNSMASFIATLVYQLMQKIPQAQDDIFTIIESNPLIFNESLESQLQKLVIQPLLRVQEHFNRFFVILIDGLDECIERAHQSNLIKLLGTVSHSRIIPVVFLVASRREPQIEAAFVRKEVSDLVLILPLDNSDIEQTSDDIRHFLTDKFQDITETHLRRHLFSTDWPPMSAIEEIITTCSGQFIYASVVVNYVSSPRGNPAHLLEIVRGIRLRDPSSQNPFAHLDALYQHIFSQVEALDKVLDILAYVLITGESYIARIEGAFQLEDGGLELCFSDLTAVIKCQERHENPVPEIKFLHASLTDFLRDKTRSEGYHINIEEYIPKLLCMFLDRLPPMLDPFSQARDLHIVAWQEYYRLWAIKDLLPNGAKASDQIRQSLITFSFTFYENSLNLILVMNVVGILKDLKKLNFDNQGQVYHHVLDLFAAELAKHWSLLPGNGKSQVRKTPELLARISQIRHKELSFDYSESESE